VRVCARLCALCWCRVAFRAFCSVNNLVDRDDDDDDADDDDADDDDDAITLHHHRSHHDDAITPLDARHPFASTRHRCNHVQSRGNDTVLIVTMASLH